MKDPHFSLLRTLALTVAVSFFTASQAQAKRIPKLYTFGPTISELGSVRKDALQKLDAGTRARFQSRGFNKVGFHYKHFGLFWLDIWSWGGEYAVYNDVNDDGERVPPAVAAALMGVEEKKLSKPLSYHIPWGLVIILGLMSLKIVPRLIAKKRQAREAAQFNSGPAWTPPPQGIPPPPPGYSPPAQPPGSSGPPPVPPPLPPEKP